MFTNLNVLCDEANIFFSFSMWVSNHNSLFSTEWWVTTLVKDVISWELAVVDTDKGRLWDKAQVKYSISKPHVFYFPVI